MHVGNAEKFYQIAHLATSVLLAKLRLALNALTSFTYQRTNAIAVHTPAHYAQIKPLAQVVSQQVHLFWIILCVSCVAKYFKTVSNALTPPPVLSVKLNLYSLPDVTFLFIFSLHFLR
jgi:hypothetical protein